MPYFKQNEFSSLKIGNRNSVIPLVNKESTDLHYALRFQ